MSLPARGDPPLRLARPASVVLAVRRGRLRRRLPADDAHRPAAHRAADPVVSPLVVGRAARGRRRARAAAGRRPRAGAPPAARSRSGCCPTSATCPQVGRTPALRRADVVADVGRGRGVRAGAPRGGRRASSGCSAAPRPCAGGSSAPGSTRPCTTSGSSRCSGGWSASPWPRRTACSTPLGGRGGTVSLAAAVRGRRSRPACSPATPT